jgi:hypothetical protein
MALVIEYYAHFCNYRDMDDVFDVYLEFSASSLSLWVGLVEALIFQLIIHMRISMLQDLAFLMSYEYQG